MQKIKSKTKSLFFILFMTCVAFTLISMTAFAAPGDYNTSDVAVINNIIATNGLNWTPAPTNGSTIPSDWVGVAWSDGSNITRTNKTSLLRNNTTTKFNTSSLNNHRIVILDLGSENLNGSLNVTGLTMLEEMYCDDNNLTSLNVTGMTNLTGLRCSNNALTALNVSGLTALEWLYCDNNNLTSLNVSGCTALVTLLCNDNALSSLNVTGSIKLLDCSGNNLASLSVSNLTALEELYCSNNNLTSLNVTNLTKIQYLNVTYNLMENESAVVGVMNATAFVAWETGNFSFSPQKNNPNSSAIPVSVSNINLDKTSTSLKTGETTQLVATITPGNASNKGLTWSSSDPFVASVDANGKVTAHKEGAVMITATTNDGNFTASSMVTVTGTAADGTSSIPGFAILTALMGLICALVLFKWRQNRGAQ
ncbi:MAG: Ig-like domain-containing protein [Methanimicrococcus sp.]|nr:Ig-like domain-containing protein [Methanimicrococcus sp.]